MSSDWNWNNEDEKASVVVPAVEAIAVYENQNLDVVIRQQDAMGDTDSIIVIPRANLAAVIKAMNALKGKPLAPKFKSNPDSI